MTEILEENRDWLDRLWRILQQIQHPGSEDRKLAQNYLKILGSSRELYLIWDNQLSTAELWNICGNSAQRCLMLSKKIF